MDDIVDHGEFVVQCMTDAEVLRRELGGDVTQTLTVSHPDGSRYTCEAVLGDVEEGEYDEAADMATYTVGFRRLTPWRWAGGRRGTETVM